MRGKSQQQSFVKKWFLLISVWGCARLKGKSWTGWGVCVCVCVCHVHSQQSVYLQVCAHRCVCMCVCQWRLEGMEQQFPASLRCSLRNNFQLLQSLSLSPPYVLSLSLSFLSLPPLSCFIFLLSSTELCSISLLYRNIGKIIKHYIEFPPTNNGSISCCFSNWSQKKQSNRKSFYSHCVYWTWHWSYPRLRKTAFGSGALLLKARNTLKNKDLVGFLYAATCAVILCY